MNRNIRGLYLPPAVLNLPALSWPARLVLAEILDLYKVNGQVWANDQHFVNRLPGTSLRTVQGAIKELVDAGILLRETNQKAQHKRLLTPADLPQILREPTAESAGAPYDLPQNLREAPAKSAADLPQNLREPTADFADINYTLNTKGNTSENDTAAIAAGGVLISEKKAAGKAGKKSVATSAEIAALELPHAGPEFAEAWRTFSTANTKQAGKPLTAFELMLKKLGKHPAGFAVVMLEAAIQGNWSGVENAGTARAFAEWQAEQARQPAAPRPLSAPPLTTGPPPRTTPDLNPEVVAQRQAQRDAQAAAARQRVRAGSLAN